ncbi:hypothetical protein CgunFtcFv8_012023 [Champsocephalus gunnari]|uniref:THAP9-like helix-turn-helix domain-containing protein n=1 Tax=Champsocephalus gunnari TaxID=52237 RepID=A0AAN8D7Y6_CHAGU|nr:hypothetical protein CgunFtcFv8_012023 [Champsocephalus gunnari]
MQALLEELKEKNLINEELKDKLECYSDLPVHLLSRQGVEYTKAQRDFHGPKAYHYLRDTRISPPTSQFIAKVAELS